MFQILCINIVAVLLYYCFARCHWRKMGKDYVIYNYFNTKTLTKKLKRNRHLSWYLRHLHHISKSLGSIPNSSY